MQSDLDKQTSGLDRFRVVGSKEAAERTNYSEEYWRRLHREGKVPPAIKRPGGRKLGWMIGDLVDWLAEQGARPA